MSEQIASTVVSTIVEFPASDHKDAHAQTCTAKETMKLGVKAAPQHIMVLVSSPESLLVLDQALRFKRPEDKVSIVHGVELWHKLQMVSEIPGSYYLKRGVEQLLGKDEAAALDVAKSNQVLKEAAGHLLQSLVHQARQAKPGELNIGGVLLTGTHSHKNLRDLALEFAHTHKVDLIVVGDKDKRLRLLGSFCDFIVQNATCTVTVVKHHACH
jgi:nucleotide-binding universal stress UspA family protein